MVQIRWQVDTEIVQGREGGGGTSHVECENILVKWSFSTKTMQTAREVCKFQNVSFLGGPI